MASYYVNVDTEVDVDLSPIEIVGGLSSWEKKELFELLAGEFNTGLVSPAGSSIDGEVFNEAITKIARSRHMLTVTEENILKQIADRLI